MNRVKVRLDRVFDVVRGSWWPHTPFTHFGFETEGMRIIDATLPCWTKVEAGMTVIALLGNANDWRSLVGWVDCSDGHIACETSYGHLTASLLLAFFALIFLRADELPWQATLLVSIVFGGGSLFYLYRSAKTFLIRRELLAIKISAAASSSSIRAG